MEECSRTVGDCIHNFRARDHRAERGITAGESLGGDENVSLDVPVLDSEVAAGASHAGHDLVRDEQNAMAAADVRDTLQISGRRNHCAQGRSTYRLEDEAGDLTVCFFYRSFEFGGVLLAAVAAAVGAIEVAAIAIRHADVGEFADHGQVDFAPPLVA